MKILSEAVLWSARVRTLWSGSSCSSDVCRWRRCRGNRFRKPSSTMRSEPGSGRMGARHLSKIQEESDSREHSTWYLPSIVQQQTGAAVRPGVSRSERQEVKLRPFSSSLNDPQRRLEKNRSLIDELTHIEAELRESVRLDEEQQQEAEYLRQQENKLQWQNLCYLSLSQRISKPWVSSYFKTFPMHIYCLPVQPAPHRGRRRGQRRRR